MRHLVLACGIAACATPAVATGPSVLSCMPDTLRAEAFAPEDCVQDSAADWVCSQRFAFREEAAELFFNMLERRLADCAGSKGTQAPEAGVNHPDSYRQRLFKISGAYVSISLKDKGQHAASFVFLRIAPER